MFNLKNKLNVWALFLSLFFLIPNNNFAHPLNMDPCEDLTEGGKIGEPLQTITSGDNAATIWHILPPTSQTGSADIEYQWMISTTDPYNFSSYTAIAGATGLNYNPGKVSQTSYYIRCARKKGCSYYPVETNVVTVEVLQILAVELSDFDLKLENQFSVDLNWETSSEFNHKHFEVERSENGREYMTVGIINGHGTTSESHEYFYTDILPNRGNFYYRLKSVEYGGIVDYSSTLTVSNLRKDDITTKIFPNPVVDRVNIDFERSFDHDLNIELYNANLKLIETYQLAAGDQLLNFDISDRITGVYYIKIPTIQGFRFQKIIRTGNY